MEKYTQEQLSEFLEFAAIYQPCFIDLALELGADINNNANNNNNDIILFHAAWHGDLKIMDVLIEKGADIHAKGYKGCNILMYASGSSTQKKETFEYLLEKGISLYDVDDDGKTVFDSLEENIKTIDSLLAIEKDVCHVRKLIAENKACKQKIKWLEELVGQ